MLKLIVLTLGGGGYILPLALDTKTEATKAFLKPEGIMPQKVLYLNPSQNGSVVWYTKPMRQKLFFSENLGLPNGEVSLPALVWAAGRQQLFIFALKAPTLHSPVPCPFYEPLS